MDKGRKKKKRRKKQEDRVGKEESREAKEKRAGKGVGMRVGTNDYKTNKRPPVRE